MFYRLSNTSDRILIEKAFDANFIFPELYTQEVLINGFEERNVPIITMRNTKKIQFAIWGLLPQFYREGWKDFQNLSNTLNISFEQVDELDWTEQLFNKQRCVIIASGFFTSYIFEGESYPYYVHDEDNKPFALAGMYSQLDDGFLTVSLLTAKNTLHPFKNVHNLGKALPIPIHHKHFKEWLADDLNFENLNIDEFEKPNLKVHPISRDIYKDSKKHINMLKPKHYDNLPRLSVVWAN